MRGAMFVAVAVTGCYAPEIREGAPCGPNGSCPSSLVCTPNNTCEASAQPVDAADDAPDEVIDAAIDSPPDGPPDAACHGSMEFSYTGAKVQFTTPACASVFQFEVIGASGGNGFQVNGNGGRGARVIGLHAFPSPVTFDLLVGGAGLDGTSSTAQRAGSGGGGSFVAISNTPFFVAGGGGGGNLTNPGLDGLDMVNGGTANGNGPGDGGTNGGGGGTHANAGYHSGTGAGGFLGDGLADSAGSSTYGTINTRGIAFVNGGAGGTGGSMGRNGGFGGGGAAGYTGGGGGGYSGGGGGGSQGGGGGGGSFATPTATGSAITPGANVGPGKITIQW